MPGYYLTQGYLLQKTMYKNRQITKEKESCMSKINNSVHYINPSTLSRNKYTGAEHVNKLKKRFFGNSELQNMVLHRFFVVFFCLF